MHFIIYQLKISNYKSVDVTLQLNSMLTNEGKNEILFKFYMELNNNIIQANYQ